MEISLRPADLKTFGKGLRAARQGAGAKGEGMTLDQVAAATGISKPYLSNIETGRTPGPPSEEKLRRIGKALGLEVEKLLAAADWLRTPVSIRRALGRAGGAEAALPRRGDGAIDLDRVMAGEGGGDGDRKGRQEDGEEGAVGGGYRYEDSLRLRAVPLINRVAAGKAGEFGDLSYPAGVADAYVAAPDLPEAPAAALFAVRVAGDSMMPEYREGDILVVGPGEAKDGDDCVVRMGEQENFATTFKRVFYVRDKEGEATGVRLVPLNPAHRERELALEEVTGVYPLVYRLVPGRSGGQRGKGKASEKLKG